MNAQPNEFARRLINTINVPCKQCGEMIPQGELSNHYENHCPQLKGTTIKEETSTSQQILMSATNPVISTKKEQEVCAVLEILLRSKSFQTQLNEKKISVHAISQLFEFSYTIFTDLRSTINNINYYFENQPIMSTLENTNPETAKTKIHDDCERCLVAIAGILFQLRAVRGLEGKLLEEKAEDKEQVSLEEPRVMQVMREMHEHLAQLACDLKDESNTDEVLVTLAIALDKHQREFCNTINSLLDQNSITLSQKK